MGVVTSCQDGMVTVSCRRREACGACASRDNCATATVAGLMSRDVTVRIPKEPGSLFQPGQLVVVEAEEGLLLRTILLLLVLPVLFLLAGALAGSYLDPADQGDAGAVAGACLGLAAGCLAGSVLSRRLGAPRYRLRPCSRPSCPSSPS